MWNKAHRVLVAGLGAMTPAFVATDGAQARSVEPAAVGPVENGASIVLDQEALKNALLELSPIEKLRIAGDRIRLAKSSTNSNVQSKRKGAFPYSNVYPTQCLAGTGCGYQPSKQRPR